MFNRKQWFLTLGAMLCAASLALAQTARVQVIHNAPNPTVDVYLNGVLTIDNFAFRTARPFLDLPAGLPLSIAVAPGNSTSVADAIATFPATFEAGKKYAVTASGIVGSTATPFTLITDDKALETATSPTKVSVNVLHGAPDAPAVDVVVRTGSKIVANLAYGQFTPYLDILPGVYYLDVKPAGSSTIVGTFKADLSTFAGGSLRIMASGLLSGSPAFGLYAVAADGDVLELPSTPVARVQVLHNSPDQTVDVWANDTRLLDDFKFLTGTPFVYLPAGPINLGVADEFSEAEQDTFYHTKATLVNGKTYLISALGIPGDPNKPFRLNIFDQAREAATDTNRVDLAFQHGTLEFSDPLDFRENYLNATFGNDLTFGQTSGYSAFAPGVGDFGFFLQPTGISLKEGRANNLVKGTAGLVFATTDPSATPSRQLRLLAADGTVTLLTEPRRANIQVIHNSPSPRVDIYYGGNLVFDNADFRHYNEAFTYSDRAAAISIAPDTSTSVKSAIAALPVALEQGKNTAAYVDGVAGDLSTPLTVHTREINFGPLTGQVEINVHHGSPGAPAVDVAVVGVGNIFSNLAYGQNSGFALVNPGVYQIQVKKAGTNESLGIFDADLTAWGGQSLNIFASGFTDKTPVFGLFFSVLDGNTPPQGLPAYELPRVQTLTKAQIIHNAASPTVDVYANGQKLLDNFKYRTATPFVDVPAGVPVSIAVAPETSTSVADAIATFSVVFDESKKYVVTASGIVGSTTTPFTLLLNDAAQTESADPNKVAVAVLHGSTDAPAVDVDAVFVANDVVDSLIYGSYSGYLSLDPTKYDLAVRAAGSASVVASYRADLSGLDGGAATVFASGRLSGTPAFGLFAALANGTVIELPLTPTARVQIIHNSPEPTVDVYAGNTRLLDNFKFRTATPFVNVPADRDIDFGVAGENSASAADALATFPVSFEAGKTYAVFANGIVGNVATPFTLLVDEAREASSDPAQVEFAVLHGSPGAAPVDLDIRLGNTQVLSLLDVAYGQFSAYLGLDPANYSIRVKATGTNTTVGTYIADLSTLGGGAARVFASGILGGTPGFGLFAALPDGTVIEFPLLPPPPTARVQIIHNSASPTVDIYADGELLLNDLQYRTATPFVDIPAEVVLSIAVAPGNSTSVADAIATFQVTFDKTKKYVVAASGIVGSPTTPFTLVVNDQARETAQTPGQVSVAVLHGSTDAPAVDVDAVFVADNVVTNLAYGQFTASYLSLAPDVYDLAVRATGNANVVATYRADLSGLAGGAATVFASGTLAGAPAFGLFAALANGTVIQLPLTPTARVQVIHNSPNPTVDVYAGNTRLLDNFKFRTATPFVTLPADRAINFGVAGENSAAASEAIANFPVTFESGRTYAVFANGIVGNATTPFTLLADLAREAAVDATKLEFATLHGAPGAPAVDVAVFGGPTLISNLAYGQFSPYLGVAPANYVLQVKPAGSQTVVANFQANLTGLGGGAARVFASPEHSGGGTPAFGLFAALPNGTVVEFPQIAAPPTARLQVIHNAASPTVDVYANGNLLLNDFKYRTATPFIEVPAGVATTLAVAPENSQSANDAIANFPVTFAEGKTYVVTASGVVGSTATPFTLIANDLGREAAAVAGTVSVSVLHGSTNAPAVDVDEVLTGNVLTNLAYGQFTPYLDLPPAIYDLGVRATGTPNPVAIFRADLRTLAGGAATVFASGLVAGTPGFGLFAALANGTVLELPLMPTARVQIIHNSPSPTVDVYAGAAKLVDDFVYRTATPFVDVPADRAFRVGVALGTSGSVADTLVGFAVNFAAGKRYTVIANGIVGNVATPFTLAVDAAALESGPAGLVAVSAFHGSQGTPNVDIVERQAGPLFQNLTYGQYAPYLNLSADEYYLDVKAAGSQAIGATFFADLTGLNGQAVRVFASGVFGGSPVFGLFAALPSGVVVELPRRPVARVQILHNAPDPVVDVYVFNQKVLDDFEFRTATPFFYIPADVALPIGVAPGNSQSVNDVIATFPTTFENGGTYIVAASGLVGGTPGFSLIVNNMGREEAKDVSKVELAVLHGIPDAPALDIQDYATDAPVLTDLQYGEFTDYLALDPELLVLRGVPTASPQATVGIWAGDFDGASGLAGVLFASGLVGNDSYDLWLMLPDGTTLPLLAAAEVQAIHDAVGADVVDLYVDEDLALDDFEFRTATNYGLFPARVPFEIAVAPPNSQSVNEAIFDKELTLRLGRTYTVVAGGIVGGTPGFDLFVNENARRLALNPTNAEFNLFHGSPNAPEVDVTLLGGSPVLFDNVQFGEFADYVGVPPADYSISVTPANDNTQVVQSYKADISALGGEAFTVFASGLLGGTPAFEAWVALADGTTFPLSELVSTNELDTKLGDFAVSPNPAVDEVMLRFSLTEPEALRYALRDVTGRLVQEGDFGTVGAGAFAQRLDVSGLPSGMYALEVVSDSGARSVKLVVGE